VVDTKKTPVQVRTATALVLPKGRHQSARLLNNSDAAATIRAVIGNDPATRYGVAYWDSNKPTPLAVKYVVTPMIANTINANWTIVFLF